MSAALQINNTPAQYNLRVMEGPDRNKNFALQKQTITIGRGLENDLVVTDLRCSRVHIQIDITPQGLVAKNVSTSNPMLVNGKEIVQALLGPGAVITIGDTFLRFELSAVALGAIEAPKNSSVGPLGLGSSGQVGTVSSTSRPPSRRPRAASNKNLLFVAIIAAIIIGGIMTNQQQKAARRKELITPDKIEDTIKNTAEEVEKLIQLRIKQGKDTEAYRESQSSFIKGMRDYREGNYRRAIQFFESARALYPDHPLAGLYSKKAQQEQDKSIQDLMREARGQMERNQFRLALGSYRRVLHLIDNKSDVTYKEAESSIQKLEKVIEGEF